MRQSPVAAPSASAVRQAAFGVSKGLTKRKVLDKLANGMVRSGGLFIIGCILAIFLVILVETYPLFKSASVSHDRDVATRIPSSQIEAIGIDDFGQMPFVVSSDGKISFFDFDSSRLINELTLFDPAAGGYPEVSLGSSNEFALFRESGYFRDTRVIYVENFVDGRRVLEPTVSEGAELSLLQDTDAKLEHLAFAKGEDGLVVVGSRSDGKVVLLRLVESYSLMGSESLEEERQEVTLPEGLVVTAIGLDELGENVFVGSEAGEIVHFSVTSAEGLKKEEIIKVGEGASISAIRTLVGGRTIIVGDSSGNISSWFVARNSDGIKQLINIHSFQQHSSPIVKIATASRNRTFATVAKDGTAKLHYSTSGMTFADIGSADVQIKELVIGAKGDRVIALDKEGRIEFWTLDNPHPEVTWQTMFGEVWYEGYEDPSFVWQSTGGTDAFESKLSLIPLIFGTLKGTFYALLFAIPLAILGALYTAEFMNPKIRAFVKPCVELMAALPSVVIGFVAGLWLAPNIEPYVIGVLMMPVVTAGVILGAFKLWQNAPQPIARLIKPGSEVLFLVPVTAFAIWLSFSIGSAVESWLMAGDYKGWLRSALGVEYDQRNSLVVGIAMGLAVIPIIFTISEDALSSIPKPLRSASLALGANSWQTAIRVVLPAASPGIFSAVMIGLGRAVGETMIVLMATGNTPILDGSMFNGFRALSANIAVELPEAPHGATLYRVLFLSALLLFALTFIINTLTEIMRVKLRKRYGQL